MPSGVHKELFVDKESRFPAGVWFAEIEMKGDAGNRTLDTCGRVQTCGPCAQVISKITC